MIAAVKEVIARFMPGSSVESADADLVHAEAALKAAKAAFAESGSAAARKKLHEANELYTEALVLRDAAKKRADDARFACAAEARAAKVARASQLAKALDLKQLKQEAQPIEDEICACLLRVANGIDELIRIGESADQRIEELKSLEAELGEKLAPHRSDDDGPIVLGRKIVNIGLGNARAKAEAALRRTNRLARADMARVLSALG